MLVREQKKMVIEKLRPLKVQRHRNGSYTASSVMKMLTPSKYVKEKVLKEFPNAKILDESHRRFRDEGALVTKTSVTFTI